MPLAICRLLTEGKGRLEGEQGLQRGRACKPAAGCTLLAARCSHTAAARTPLAWPLPGARCVPLARLTPAAPHAAPLHGCWGLLHGPWGLLHDCWGLLHDRRGLLHGRQLVHAAPGTPLRAACSHGRRAPPPQAACTAQRPFWEQPPAPHRTGAVEQPGRAQGVPIPRPTAPRGPQISPGPVQSSAPSTRLQPSPRAHTWGPRAPNGRGKEQTPRGCGAVPPTGSPPALGHPSAHRRDPVGDRVLAVWRGRAGRRAQRCAHLFRFTERIKKNSKNEIIG